MVNLTKKPEKTNLTPDEAKELANYMSGDDGSRSADFHRKMHHLCSKVNTISMKPTYIFPAIFEKSEVALDTEY